MEQEKPLNYYTIEPLYQNKGPHITGFCCSYSHLSSSDFRHVYEPLDDSFLLIDSFECDRPYILEKIKPAFVLEVG